MAIHNYSVHLQRRARFLKPLLLLFFFLRVDLCLAANPDIEVSWTKPGLTASDRDALVAEAGKRSFKELAPALLHLMARYKPSDIKNGKYLEKPWNRSDLSPDERINAMASAVWGHFISIQDPATPPLLLDLLSRENNEENKKSLIVELSFDQWIPDAEAPIAAICNDKHEPLDVRSEAVSALLRSADPNKYADAALKVVLEYKLEDRSEQYNQMAIARQRAGELNQQNKTRFIRIGFDLLNSLPDNDNGAYFVACDLEDFLGVKFNKGTNDVGDRYFSDTVVTAKKWYKENFANQK